MSKIGRNDPCHCGSGKKYKKCCWEKDQEESLHIITGNTVSPERWEPEAAKEILYEDDLQNDFETEEEHFDEESYLENKDEKRGKVTDKPYPAISDQEQKLVDVWWDKYELLKEPDEIKKHIQQFMNAYPHLVENLGMEHEVLFELGADYMREGRLDEYIHFVLKLRNEFPSMYIRSAGYYDSDIIAWLIANKRGEEIENYLNYFAAYPVEFVDQLFEMVGLLTATDNTALMPGFISTVHKQLSESADVINGGSIVTPLVTHLASKYLKPGYTTDDIAHLIQDLSNEIHIELNDNTKSIEFWKSRLDQMFRPFVQWSNEVPKKKSQLESLYYEMGNNFMRYLHEHKNLSWISAQYYVQLICSYLYKSLDKIKGKPRQIFDFHKDSINEIGGSLSQSFIFLNATKALGILNSIYYFAGYLQLCGNIDEQQKATIQRDCIALHNELYPSLKKEYAEALCFPAFPFWG